MVFHLYIRNGNPQQYSYVASSTRPAELHAIAGRLNARIGDYKLITDAHVDGIGR